MFAVTTEFIKIRDLTPTAVRLRPEIKKMLIREAEINGRSVHSEIVLRLTESLNKSQGANTHGLTLVRAAEPAGEWTPQHTDTERALLSLFRQLSPEKQLALLMLLK